MKRNIDKLIYYLLLVLLVYGTYCIFQEKIILTKDVFSYIKDKSSRLNYREDVYRHDDVCVVMFSDTVRKRDVVNISRNLLDAGAKAVGLDFRFEKDVPNEADTVIVSMAKADKRLVLSYDVDDGRPIYYNCVNDFDEIPSMGYSNFMLVDGVTRFLNKKMEIQGQDRKSFATIICERYLGQSCDDPRELIDFRYLCNMIDYNESGFDFDSFKDKIVIVGCKTINDFKVTPGRLMYGAELHAIAVSTILANERAPISKVQRFLWPFLITLICVTILVTTGFRWSWSRKFRWYMMLAEPLVCIFSVVFSLILIFVIPSYNDYWWALASIPIIASFIYSVTKKLFYFILKLRHEYKKKHM